MKTYRTASGSTYEVDEERRLIRRVSGTHPPTENQGEDGHWQFYHAVTVTPTGCLLIAWHGTKGTLTSRIVETVEL